MSKSSSQYTVVGRIPELNYYLLRNETSGGIEAWTPSKGVELNAIKIQGVELEFVRPVRCAYRIPDNDYNRANAPEDIGRIYIDYAPLSADVVEIK